MSTAVPALVAAMGSVAHAGGLPTGGVPLTAGTNINTLSATQMQITSTTSRSAISWQDFSIPNGSSVNVAQPNAASTQLEQVRGTNVSQIFGSLTSNGSIVIANPNGIWFGPNAQVDVAGLAAVAASPSAADVQTFIHGGSLNLSQAGNANAAIINQGNITISNAGLAAFVAPGVRNDGIIQAKLGTVQLSSGTTATLDFYGDGLISIAVAGQTLAQAIDPSTGKPMSAAVVNTGTLAADGGTVLLTANAASNVVNDAINVSGVVQAQSVTMQGDQIVLGGNASVVATNTTATTVQTGQVTVNATGGNIQVAGTLDASGYGAGQTGGNIQVTGQTVNVATTAFIDASGDDGGGTVYVGGGPHGQGTTVTAKTTTVSKGATIKANAVTNGNGGTVAIWSEKYTSFDGTIDAMGGAQFGHGGFVETSGAKLTVGGDATVNTSAPRGQSGLWLLDPNDINIDTSGNTGTISPGTITTALSSGNVEIDTENGINGTAAGTSGTGTITVNNAIIYSGGNSLGLFAENDININASIQNSGSGALNLVAGWNPSAGTNIATISANTSDYGQTGSNGAGAGSVAIGNSFQLTTVAVGSANGTTTVLGNNVSVNGEQDTVNSIVNVLGGAQIGFNVPATSFTSASGSIVVDALGTVSLTSSSDGWAQIGHGGYLAGASYFSSVGSVSLTGAITVNAAAVSLTGGNFDGNYAQIGHGGNNAFTSGDAAGIVLGGAITVNATGSGSTGNVTVNAGSDPNSYAQIGHGGFFVGEGNSSLTNFSTSGNITINATGTVAVEGGSGAFDDYAQIGHGGDGVNDSSAVAGTATGNVAISAAALSIDGGSNSRDYAQIGHGSAGIAPKLSASGNIDIRVTGTLSASTGAGMLIGDSASGAVSDPIFVEAGDLSGFSPGDVGNTAGGQVVVAVTDPAGYTAPAFSVSGGNAFALLTEGPLTIGGAVNASGGGALDLIGGWNGTAGVPSTAGATTFDLSTGTGALQSGAYGNSGNGITLSASVSGGGAVTFAGPVALGGNVTVSSGGTLDFLSTLNGNGDNITFIDDTAPVFGSTVSSIGTATLAPFTATDTIGVGDSSKQTLVGTVKYDFISTGNLFKLEGAAATVGIGTGSDSGTITATPLTLTPGLVLTNGSTGGIAFSGGLGAGSLLAQSGSGDIALDGGTIVTTGGQTYSGSITLGGDTLLEATASTATVTFGVAENYNSANNLAVLVGGGLTVNSSIQNSGSGALSLIAGWDGTAPTSAADVSNLISGTHYGSTGGNVVIGSGSQGSTVAVGSAGGATTVLADNVTLNGSSTGDSNYLIAGHNGTGAQIGFNVPSGGTADATGSITVDARGAVSLQAGSGNAAFVQIGHGGVGAASGSSVQTQSLTGNILVNAASVTLAAGGPNAYAQIGHGGLSFANGANELYLGSLSFGGDITVDASGAVALAAGSGGDSYAQIGHGGTLALFSAPIPVGFTTTGNITVGAASLSLTAGSSSNYAEIGHGEDPSDGLTYGTHFAAGGVGGVSGNIDITVSGTLSATPGQAFLIGSRAAGTVTTPLFLEAGDFGGGNGGFNPGDLADTAGGQVVIAVTDPAGYTTGGFAAAGGNPFALLTVGPLITTGAITGDNQLALVGGWDGSTGLPAGGAAFDITAVLNGAAGTVYGKSGNGVSLGGNVSTSLSSGPAVALAGPVALTTNVTLAAGTGGNIEVLSALDSDSNATPRGLTVSGNVVFDGAVGATHPLGVLAVSGTTDIAGGSVATTGGQTYTGAVSLGGDTMLSDSGGGIVFGNTVTGTGATLDVTQGATTFDNAVTVGLLSTQAVTFDITAGSVSTTAGQTYNGAATLDANTTLSDSGGGIVFGGTVNGAHDLDVILGATTFSGAVGVGSIKTQAATFDITSGSVATTGGQTYSGAATLGANTTLVDSGGNAIQFGSTLAGGNNNLTIVDDALPVFGGAVSAIGTATLAPFTTTDTIAVGDSTGGTHPLVSATVQYDFINSGNLFKLEGGANTIAIGTGSNTGAITLTQLTLTPSLALVNGGTGGITVAGAFDSGNGSFTAQSGSGGIALSANVTTGAGQTYSGAVTLGASTVTLVDSSTAGITFGSTVTGTGDALDVTTGTTTFGGAVAVGALSVQAANIDTSSIAATAGQAYSGAVTLGADTTLSDTSGNSALGIQFLNTVDSDGTARALTTSTTGTSVSFFTHTVGGAHPLASIDVIGRSDFSFGGLVTPVVTTTGAQTYNGLMLFGGVSTTLVSTSGGAIDVLGGTSGNEVFAISTTGTVSLAGTFGSLASLTIDSGPGAVTISSPSIVTTGGQLYDHPVVLAATTTLTAGGSGVDFADAVDSSGTGVTTDGHSLTVSGNATFGGAVGANFALGSLLVTGTTALNGGTVDTTGSQTYSGAITLGGNTTLDSAAGDGAIFFGGAVNGASDTLTINTGTGGVIFSGLDFNVANLTIIGPETLDTGTYTLTGGTLANSSGIGFEGILDFAQDTTFASAVTLDADTSIVTTSGSAAITFGSTVNGGFGLTVNTAGATAFDSTVGNSAPLTHLTVDGPATLGATVITSGNQTYSGAITLGGDVLLEATAATATITFDGATSDNNADNFAVLSGGAIDVNASIQNGGSGAVSLIAGWDGTAPTSAADVSNLIVGHDYGHGLIGNVLIGDGTQTATVAVGSAAGATTVAGANITLTSGAGAAQIGFNVPAGQSGTASGSIGVYATGAVDLANNGAGFTQIGHGGANAADTGSDNLILSGNIVVDAASVTLADGSGTAEYAQIGHGGYGAFGSPNINGGSSGNLSVGGNVTVDATGDVDLVAAGSFTDTYVQIGNGGGLFAGNSNPASFALSGNVIVSAGGTVTINAGNSVAQIGLGGAGAFNGMSGFGVTGDISIGADTLTMVGNSFGFGSQTAIIGDVGGSSSGSFFGSVNGNIDVRVTNTFSTTNGVTFGGDASSGTQSIYVQAKALSGFGPNDLAQDTGLGEVVVAITDPGTLNVGTISSGGGNPFALLAEGALNVTGPITNGGDVVLVGGWNGTSGAATFGSGNSFDLSAATGVLSSAGNYGNGGNGIAFSANVFSTGGNIALAGPVTLVTNELFSANTTTFYGTVDSGTNTGAPWSPTVQGNAVFDGVVGGLHPLGELEVFTGTTTISGGTVITTGGQIYNNTVTLGADTTLSDSSGSSPAIQFVGAVTDGGNDHALDITTGSVGFGGNVSVGTLSTQAATVAGGGTIATTFGQTYGGAVTLALDTTLNAFNNSDVTFDSTIDSASGNHALTINNGSGFGTVGTTTFSGSVGVGGVGTSTALSHLAAGQVVFGGSSAITIQTTDGQSYGGTGPDRDVTLAQDTTLTDVGTGVGNRISVGFDIGGGHNLTINEQEKVLFGGGVGNNNIGVVPLASLTINGSVGGNIQFNGPGVTTTAGQFYGSPVTLFGGDKTFTAGSGSSIVFADSIVDSGGSAALIVPTGTTVLEGSVNVSSVSTQAVTFDITSGSIATSGGQTYSGAATLGADTTLNDSGTDGITFGSTVDGAHALDVTQGATTFDDTVTVGSLSVQAANIDGGSVATTGGQTYSGAVTLGGATTLDTTDAGANAAGANIAFDAAGTSVDDGNHNVTLNAGTGGTVAVVGAWTGGGTPTETLLIANSGGATFSGTVSVGTVSIATTTGTVSFLGALTATDFDTSAGGYAVALTGNGSSIEDAVVFNNTGGVTLGGGAGTTLDFDHGVTSIAGMTTLAGAIHSDPPAGGQQYGAVTLAADTDLTESAAGTISFSGDVNSAPGQHFALTINTPGAGRTSFGGSVGNSQPLSSLDITGGAATTIVGGTLMETTGDQTYGNPLSLTNSSGVTFESTNGGTISLPSVTANAGVTVIDLTGTTDLTGSLFTTDGSQVWDTGLGLPVNAFVFDAQGTTSDITVGVAIGLNGGNDLTFLAGRDINFNAGVQNSGGGAVNAVAGYDGSSGLSSGGFSFGDLVAANTSAHQSYGNNSGSVFVNGATGTVGVAVGSAGGATDIAGFDIVLQGGSGPTAFAQLGYRGDIGNAPIAVLAADNVTLAGGSGTSAYAQIGHGGELVDASANLGAVTLGGAIDVSAVDNIVLQGGNGDAFAGAGAYAQIGHGGLEFAANMGTSDTTIGAVSITGDITVTSTGSSGTISLTGGDQWAYAQIGHGGMAFAEDQTNNNNETLASATLSGNITVGAAGTISLKGGTATDDAFDAYAQIGHGGDAALSDIGNVLTVTGPTLLGGTISVSSSAGSVTLSGNDDSAYAQIGDGGITFGANTTFADVTVGDGIRVSGATGVSLTGGAGGSAGYGGAYAQIGHGGLAMLVGATATAVDLSGVIAVDSSGGNVSLSGSDSADSFAQIGHGGDLAFAGANLGSLTVGGASDTIGVSAGGNVTLAGGTGGDAYAQIGDGGDQVLNDANVTGSTTLGGAITVTAVGDVTVEGGSSTTTTDNYAQIGHGGFEFAANTGNGAMTLGDLSVTGAITVTSTGSGGTISLGGGKDQSDYAQIGHGGLSFAYNGPSGTSLSMNSITLSGNITVGAADNISLTGGTGGSSADAFDAYAQIGHGGDSALSDPGNTLTVNGTTTLGGTISVVSSTGSVTLHGNDDYAYTQIGHGGLNFATFATLADVNVTGAITVSGANGVSLTGGAGSTVDVPATHTSAGAYAQIGHGGEQAFAGVTAGATPGNVTLDGAITVDGGTGGVSVTGGSASGNPSNGTTTGDAYAQIGHGGDQTFAGANFASLTVGGTADTIGITAGAVSLAGGSGGNDYAQIGDGGDQFASGATIGTTVSTVFSGGTVTLSGDITVGAVSVTLSGDTSSGGTAAYVQIGHGGAAALYNATVGDVTVSGDVAVTASNGDISLTAGSGDLTYAQIGHGGAFFGSAYNFVDGGGTTILTGTGATFGSVTLDGNVTVEATNTGGTSGGVLLHGGGNSYAYAHIGHGGADAFAGTSCGCSGGPVTLASLTVGGVGEAITVTGDNGIGLTGGSSEGAYAQIGHGGEDFAAGATITNAIAVESDIAVTANNGYNFGVVGGSGDGAYAQIGNGGLAFADDASFGSATIGGNVDVTAPNSYVFAISGSGGYTFAYAQIGHGGAFAFAGAIGSPTYVGTVSVDAFSLGVGSFSPVDYGAIGSGDPLPTTIFGGNGTLTGTVDVTTLGDQRYFVAFTDVILAPGTYGTSNGTISFSDGSGVAPVVLSGSIAIDNSNTIWGPVQLGFGVAAPNMAFNLSGQNTEFTGQVAAPAGPIGAMSLIGGDNFTIDNGIEVYVTSFTDSGMTGLVNFGTTLNVGSHATLSGDLSGDIACAGGGLSCVTLVPPVSGTLNGISVDVLLLQQSGGSGNDPQDQTLHLFNYQYALSNPDQSLGGGGVNPQAGCSDEEKKENGGKCPAGSGDATTYANQFLNGHKP